VFWQNSTPDVENSHFFIFLRPLKRVVSSAGSEHYLDRVGVTGSNPVQPTQKAESYDNSFSPFFILQIQIAIETICQIR
jgi:hypothetical protein